MADLQPAPAETPETSLRKGRIGVIGIVFFVVAAAAPLVGMTGAVPVATVLGNGAGVPGAYRVVAFILLLERFWRPFCCCRCTQVTSRGSNALRCCRHVCVAVQNFRSICQEWSAQRI